MLVLIAVYLWGGATTVLMIWEMESIAISLNKMLPDEKKLKTQMRENWGVVTFIFMAWVFILPMQLYQKLRSRRS